ncbi:MAG: peptidylprolyl isomerase [Alphaproteobacteria bacterium]|nr:MAG: peptidylprolyl isomerase [Alphaproteobacteria bacterium]
MRPFRPSVMTVAPVLLAAVLALSACGQGQNNDRPPEANDRAVATVQGDTIWASDVKREAVAQGLIGETEPLDVNADLFRRVLDEVIDRKLLAAEAERRGLDDAALVQRRLEATRERILGDVLIEEQVSGQVSEERIQALYADQVRRAQTTDEVRIRLILSRTREEAAAVIGVLAQGAAFEAVAAQSSIDDATRFSGGDLGYRTLDVLPQAYADALREQPAGSTVGPVQTEAGWAVLRVEDRRRETPPTLEQARPQIVRFLTYEGIRQQLEQLRGRAKIERLIDDADAAATASPAGPAQ